MARFTIAIICALDDITMNPESLDRHLKTIAEALPKVELTQDPNVRLRYLDRLFVGKCPF